MIVLTEQEVAACQYGEVTPQLCEDMLPFAENIEAAVIRKLAAGVSVDPVAWIGMRGGVRHMTSQWAIAEADAGTYDTPLYTAAAIAAARVQENERCAARVDDSAQRCQLITGSDLRALLGKEAT